MRVSCLASVAPHHLADWFFHVDVGPPGLCRVCETCTSSSLSQAPISHFQMPSPSQATSVRSPFRVPFSPFFLARVFLRLFRLLSSLQCLSSWRQASLLGIPCAPHRYSRLDISASLNPMCLLFIHALIPALLIVIKFSTKT